MERLQIAIFLGGLLAFVRKKKGISNRQFKDATGYSSNDIYKIEKGFTNVSHDRLEFILASLNISLDEFYGYAPLYIADRDKARTADSEQKPQKPSQGAQVTKSTKSRKTKKP